VVLLLGLALVAVLEVWVLVVLGPLMVFLMALLRVLEVLVVLVD
jgi:hypothetical protein